MEISITFQDVVCKAIELAGGPTAAAAHFGLKPWAISKWRKRLPESRVIELSRLIEYQKTPHQLAPNIYPHPDDGLPEHLRKGIDA